MKQEEEIDILAYRDDQAVFGECKWRNQPVDIDVYDELCRKSRLFDYDKKYYYLYAKKGFTERVITKSQNDPTIKLINFEDM